ncbi:MAG: chromate transporter [Eubacteriales bacterium]|nr:chromate transporter [Eubacteriales bacterium]
MIFFRLFIEFFKIGLFAVGGGMATLPFLMDLANSYDWYTVRELTNMVAISQSTPGPVGVNMATYAGYNAAGVLGAVIATLGLVTPALFIIVIIAKFLADFSEDKRVQGAFYGIRPTVAALIAYAVWELIKISFSITDAHHLKSIDYLSVILCLALFAVMQHKRCRKLHPLVWIVIGAVLGILFKL